MGNNVFTIISFFYSLMLNIIFFSKKRIKNIETNLYSYIVATNFINIIFAIVSYEIENMHGNDILNSFFAKGVIVCFYTFSFIFNMYVILISKHDKKQFEKKKMKRIVFVYLLFLLPIIFLPLTYYNDGNVIYSYGACANYTYVIVSMMIIYWIFLIIKNFQLIKRKKCIPIITFVILLVVVAIIQKINPQFLLLTSLETFVAFLMYFTIENPDIKMLNELYKNKELTEQNYEDKYNFLFEMTQEARNPIVNINNIYNEIRNEEDSEKIKDGLYRINNLCKQLDFSINNVLNISSLDIQRIKIVETKYDLEKVCKDLEIRIKNELQEGVKFNLELPKQIPILYGDYLKIRQIIYSLLINACKNTSKGNINLKVNLIEKYDIARVIFNISDTGSGMTIDKINEVLGSTGELQKDEIENLEKKEFNLKVCQKVMKIMGGNLMIKSNLGKGTEVILTIDEKVYHEKEKSVLSQYEEEISNYKRALIVSQDKKVINYLKKKLTEKNITVSVLYYGALAIDKIKSGKKYDFILVQDEMEELSGYMTLKGMEEVKDFNIPTIVMLKEDKEKLKKHFIEDGFNDAILLNNIDSDVERIIEKY